MSTDEEQRPRSAKLAARIYEASVRDRQRRRADLRVPESDRDIEEVRQHNFEVQALEPRNNVLQQIRDAGAELSTADKVSLLVMTEMSAVDATALLHRVSVQLADDPNAFYFSRVNMADNCGCGCGCGCSVMRALPDEQRIALHRQLKPFSIDPFNEAQIPQEERDGLLIRDFLASYEGLTADVRKGIEDRYFRMGHEFV